MNDTLDTFLNVTVFAFIGLLIWLYLRPAKTGSGDGLGAGDGSE